MAKILIIASKARSLINFRGDLIQTILEKGHCVYAMAPDTDFEDKMKSWGVKYYPITINRTGLNPAKDFFALTELVKKFKDINPDIIFAYTIKPVIYGSLAAWVVKVPSVYSLITGLGYGFVEGNIKQKTLSKFVRSLYRQALRNNKVVFFQNPDDMNKFNELNLISSAKSVLVNGSGVNNDKFYYSKPPTNTLSFLIIARLIKEKGICEFVEAARYLKKKYPEASFKILGSFDSNPSALNKKDIERWVSEGTVEYLGETEDVRPYIKNSSVYVLPSYYPEGTPRSVLEAMSMGRPIITTDAPGCRETVKQGINGYLVPVKDVQALTKAMEQFILNSKKITEMGMKSREIAEEKYDVHKVNQVILQNMGLEVPVKQVDY